MKKYLKPEVELVEFATEAIAVMETPSGEDDGGLG